MHLLKKKNSLPIFEIFFSLLAQELQEGKKKPSPGRSIKHSTTMASKWDFRRFSRRLGSQQYRLRTARRKMNCYNNRFDQRRKEKEISLVRLDNKMVVDRRILNALARVVQKTTKGESRCSAVR